MFVCQSVKSDICKLADLFSFMNQKPRYSVNVALLFYTMALPPFLFKLSTNNDLHTCKLKWNIPRCSLNSVP